jgi:hypothetical protein
VLAFASAAVGLYWALGGTWLLGTVALKALVALLAIALAHRPRRWIVALAVAARRASRQPI